MEDEVVEQLIECLPPDRSYGEAYNKLIEAFRECDVDALKSFIELGISPNVSLFDEHSPLTLLIGTSTSNRWQEVAKLLLECGACPNKRNPKGTSVLSLLVSCGEPELVNLAIEKGADIEATGSSNETAVLTAVHYKQVHCLKTLLDRGANPNITSQEGNTAVMWAAGRSNGMGYPKSLAAMKLLLQYGADPSKCNDRGYTPLMAASLIREPKSVRALIAAGADTEAADLSGETAVFKAVYSNCSESVTILATSGANVNARCKMKRTPLMVVNSYPILDILLKHDSDVKAADCDGYTALHHYAITNKPQFLRLLLVHGAGIESRCNLGNTPLQIAIRSRSSSSIELLISRGANVSTKNDTNVSLFHEIIIPWDFFKTINVFPVVNTRSLLSEIQDYLVSDDSVALVKELRGKGGACDVRSAEGVTPLMLAALCGDLALCRLLLTEGGADPYVEDGHGRGVLAYTCRGGQIDVVNLLLQRNCAVNSVDDDANLPIYYAAQFSYTDIVELLLLELAFYMCYSVKRI